MKKFFLLFALLGLVNLSSGAAFTSAHALTGSTTNTLMTNSILIRNLWVITTNTANSTLKFYDSVGGTTTIGWSTAVTNRYTARVTVTEYQTNAIYSFTTSIGHTTNIILRVTNSTTYLWTTNTPVVAATNELGRVLVVTAPGSSAVNVALSTPFEDVNGYFARGVTVANVGAAGVTLIINGDR